MRLRPASGQGTGNAAANCWRRPLAVWNAPEPIACSSARTPCTRWRATSLPLLHIAELTADELEAAGVSTVGLLGTRYTMEQDFYTRKLVERGITVLIPEEDGRAFVNRVIFDELCLGTVSESSRRAFAAIIGGLTARGAQGVILGCTEIGLLVRPGDTSARLFDTTEIHARRAALYALGEAVPRDGGE